MRILHTADWHHTDALGDVTGPAIDFIVEQAGDIKPDAIVIAGDLIMKRGIISPQESLTIRESILRCAEIAPTIVIPGNHDISNRYDRVDAVTGLLARLKKDTPTLHDRLYISARPGTIRVAGLDKTIFFTLPHPSKYIYLAKTEEIELNKIDAELTKKMEQIITAFTVEATEYRAQGYRTVLIGHGTVNGGVADSEKVLTNENDLVIDRHWIGDYFDAVMYGHLHKRQSVGSVFYCGAAAPLTFGQEKMVPSFELWDLGTIITHEPVKIPVAHQMLTVEVPKESFSDQNIDPVNVVFGAIEPIAVKDARVRVRVEIHRERRDLINKKMIEEFLDKRGVHSHKVMIDTVDPVRIRAESLDPDQGMNKMLEVWSELDPDRANSLSMMQEIDKDVSGSIPPDILHQLQGINYRLQRIKAVNFKPLIDVDINFDELGSIICITGENHTGKSQVAETERFVNWKKLRKGTQLKDAVRLGCKSTEVTSWFTASEQGGPPLQYRIRRTLKLDKTGGKASSDVILSKKVGENWEPMNEGDSKETQVSIERLVGSYNMYLSTRFGSQQDIDRLCSLSPAEMKETLQEAMNFKAFDLRRKEADNQLKILRGDYENVIMKMEDMGTEIEQEAHIKDSLSQLKKSKAQKVAEVEGLRTQRDETQRKIDNARQIENKRTELVNKKNDLQGKVEGEERTIRTLDEVLQKKDQVTAGIQRQATLQTKHDDLNRAQAILADAIQTLSTDQNTMINRRNEVQTNSTNRQLAIDVCKRDMENKQEDHNGKIRDAQAAISRAEVTAALTDEVPCNGMDLQSECKLLENANKAKANIISLKAVWTRLEANLPDHSETIWAIEKLATPKENLEAEITTLTNQINTQKPIHKAKQDHFQTNKGELDKLLLDLNREKEQKWLETQEKVLVADTNLKNAKANLDRLTTERSTVLQELDRMGDEVDTATLSITVDSLTTSMNSIENQRDNVIGQIGVLEQNLGRLDTVKADLQGLEEINRSGLARINAFVHYLAAVSRDGIPYLLMEKALPRFEEFANNFLCVDEGFGSVLRVKIDPFKDTQDGKEKDEVVITFNDERGNHPLGEASGFQRVAVGYSLRAAMAKIQAEATGITIHHCIFDEGWGAFDQNNLLLARRMIEKLGEEFGKFFYITHVPVLQEVADTIIHVKSVDGGAVIEIA